jgi:hypothetical protein
MVTCRRDIAFDHTQGHTTVDRTPLDEGSARRRDLYLTTHKTLITNIHAPGGIQTHNLSRLLAADPRLRPLGHNLLICGRILPDKKLCDLYRPPIMIALVATANNTTVHEERTYYKQMTKHKILEKEVSYLSEGPRKNIILKYILDRLQVRGSGPYPVVRLTCC